MEKGTASGSPFLASKEGKRSAFPLFLEEKDQIDGSRNKGGKDQRRQNENPGGQLLAFFGVGKAVGQPLGDNVGVCYRWRTSRGAGHPA